MIVGEPVVLNQRFRIYLNALHLAPCTRYQYARLVARFFKRYGYFSRGTVRAFLEDLADTDISESTLVSYLAALRKFGESVSNDAADLVRLEDLLWRRRNN